MVYHLVEGETILNTFNASIGYDLSVLDPKGGVLSLVTYWRPRRGRPDLEPPGEKVQTLSYLPLSGRKYCLCGSGKRFASCCRELPYWRPLCPNPGMHGFSLMHPRAACFTPVDTDEIYAFLQNDERLYCSINDPHHAFWIYWGDPVLYTPNFGRICFGDFELRENYTLLVSALSETRMEVLLDVLRPLNLRTPQIQLDPAPRVMKPIMRVL